MSSKLKAVRAGHRGVLTRLLKTGDPKANPQQTVAEFRSVMALIRSKQKTLSELNDQILDVTEETDVGEEIEEASRYELEIEIGIAKIQEHIEEVSQSTNQSALNPNAPEYTHVQTHHSPIESNSEHPSTIHSSASSHFHKLPKLNLPTFDGNILEWLPFWDSFTSAVHENPSLSEVQKFNYLKSQLYGEARESLAGLQITGTNYGQAVSILHERFGQQYKIVNAYMQNLINLPTPTHGIRSLKSFRDLLESYIRGLESMGHYPDSYSSLLIPHILNKLPSSVRHNITRDHGNDDWEISALRSAIKKEICIQEAIQTSPADNEIVSTASFVAGGRKWKSGSSKGVGDNTRISRKKSCLFCNEMHHPSECTKVTEKNARLKIVKEKRVCFNCFGNHRVSECMSKYKCRHCGKKHHSSICNENRSTSANYEKQGSKPTTQPTTQPTTHPITQPITEPSTQSTTQDVTKPNDKTTAVHSTITEQTEILLKTAVAPVWYKDDNVMTNILLDEGAQNSFITYELAEKLQIKPSGTVSMQISAFGGNEGEVRILDKATISLETESQEKIQMEVIIVPKIAAPIHMKGYAKVKNLSYLQGLHLAHPVTHNEQFNISLLIGADHYWSVVQDEIIRGDGPTAVKSKIGYLLSGPLHTGTSTNWSSTMMNILVAHKPDEMNLQKFWEIESCGTGKENDENMTEPQNTMMEYQKTSIDFKDGKYVAKLPWKSDHPELPTNEFIARRRTQNVINRLAKDPEMLQMYSSIIKGQEINDFIEKVPDRDEDSSGRIHYIPHHPVKKESSRTPVRIVYDCSCRENAESPSLNDCLSSEPPVLNKLTNIITRFRLGKFGITTDIEKAFLNIRLHEEDRDSTRFFWLSDPSNPQSALTTYRFKAVLFGATCSPFILNATLFKHLTLNQSKTSDIITRDLYVDNVLTSMDSEEAVAKYFKDSRKLLQEGGFNLRSWMSNSDNLKSLASTENVLDSDNETKILGLRWNSHTDTLKFADTKLLQTEDVQITKREILRQSSSIYDPIGFLGPITVKAKIMMQGLWKKGYSWDEVLPTNVTNEWKDVKNDIVNVTKELQIPRYYFEKESQDGGCKTLHVFVDASQKAYGASVYISKGDICSFVIAKNRVAPLKEITLPKLELMAAVIGARIAKELIPNLEIDRAVFWSDSQIVLHWLTTKKPLNRFVKRRISEIQEITTNHEWKYIPTDMNPADLQTRGISAIQFTDSTLWKHGPSWLADETKWPIWNEHMSNNTVLASLSNQQDETVTQSMDHKGLTKIMDISKYSSLQRLLAVTSYVMRFIKSCKIKRTYRLRSGSRDVNLSNEEIIKARNLWIKEIQNDTFSEELENIEKVSQQKPLPLVKQLNLYLDNDGIMRCKGRMHNSELDEDAKFPILLPKKHKFTDLVIMKYHLGTLHSGVGQTVTSIRQLYWIPSIRQCVNHVLRKCVQCQKVLSKPYVKPTPPPLPRDRVNNIQPFATTGIDFAGPLNVKDGSTTRKVYICLFTCACIRAIHLELIPDLTVNSFMLAFRRFISRKATPKNIYSDNAQTFVAASSEIQRELNLNINWKFIPVGAPWYGGWWERMIGITKMTLKKVLGRSLTNEETLRTLITEIETIINNRPLTYISSDIRDPQPLTPSHLLHGRTITTEMSHDQHNAEMKTLDTISANKLMDRKGLIVRPFR